MAAGTADLVPGAGARRFVSGPLPVLLAADRSTVSVSPQDGFLHPRTELDTLGADQPETGCKNR